MNQKDVEELNNVLKRLNDLTKRYQVELSNREVEKALRYVRMCQGEMLNLEKYLESINDNKQS